MKSACDSKRGFAEAICLKCGLCCNGVIFADVKLQPAERLTVAEALESMPRATDLFPAADGRTPAVVPAAIVTPSKCLAQPCAAFDGRLCRIYADRPKYCRQFECALLKRVKEGHHFAAAALVSIRSARKKAGVVRGLLRLLGDTDERTALAARFRRATERAEQSDLEGEPAARFGKLTRAMHELNHMLASTFYPGA